MQDNEAIRVVRRFSRGVALADGTPWDARYIVDGSTGELVIGVEPEMLDATEMVLCLPDETFEADARILIDFRAAEEDAWTDRHLAYHPTTRPNAWARARIDSVKLRSGRVVDADEVSLANPLSAIEPSLCKRLNADRDALGRLSKLFTGVEPEEPVAVGVDSIGIDVRARFGVIRIEHPSPCTEPEQAGGVIEAMIEASK